MAELGALWYTMGIKDLTDADLKKINAKLKSLGADITLTPKIIKQMTQDAVPKGIKIELDPKITSEALQKALENKTMKVAVTPLLTGFREAIVKATKENPPLAEIGVQEAKLRSIIQNVLNKQGFMLNISTVNDNYSKAIQQKLNGRKYTVTIHADAKEITRSVQASLMQVQSRHFGLQVSKDILRNSIDQALMGKPFNIQIAVMHDQARRAVQNALNNARMVGKDDALAYQRLKAGEYSAARAEIARLRAEQLGAASAANTHASTSGNLGGALGSNIKIAGELGAAMASLYSIHAAKQFLSQVIEIGGELEHQKIALETIYGTESKMESLYGQIKGLARQSPFGVMELTKNVKQLSAYGVAYNEVYDTAKRLADISAATSVDIQRLILAYGKTKNRTFLDGLEAKQFAYANIPIYDALSKKLTELEGKFVSVKDVMGRIKKREIGFDMVKDILWDMTDEGGKFYNMQEKLAGSVKTSWKLVRDNIELMFGEIAESSVGSGLKGVAEILQGLTREWKTVSAVVATGAIGLGIYKVATLGVNTAVQKGTIATYKDIIAKKQKNAEELKAWGRITQLNRAELMRIATANKLTNADLRLAITEGKLTDKHIAQLFWQKKITAEQVKYLASIGLLDPAMAKAILANNKYTLSLQMMKQGMKSAGVAMKSMLFNWWTAGIVGVSALIGVVTKYYEKQQRIKELSNDLSKKGFDGYESMAKQLKDLDAFDVNTASSAAINSKIEEMKTTLKDYSLTAEDTFRTVFGPDADGKIMSQKEQFEALRQAIQDTANAYNAMKNGNKSQIFNSESAKAASSSGAAFDKSVSNTAETYGKIIEDVENLDKVFEKIEIRQAKLGGGTIIDEQATQQVKDHVKSLSTLEEKLEYLSQINATFKGGSNVISDYLGNLRKQKLKEKEATESIESYLSFLENRYKAVDPNFKIAEATREEKERFLQESKAFIDAQEKWSEQMKSLALNLSFEYANIESPRLTEMYDKLFKEVKTEIGPELAEKVVNGIELTEEEKGKVDTALKKAYNTIFKDAYKWQQDALAKAFTSKDNKGQIIFDPNKIARMRVRMQVIPELEDWQQEIYKQLGGDPVIKTWLKGAPDTQSFIKAAQDGYKSAREGLNKLKPLAIKAGLNLNFNLSQLKRIPMVTKQYADASPAVRKMIDEYNEFVDAINAAQKAGSELGFDPAAEYNKGHKEKKNKGSQKDKVAEDLKQRFKDIKDAYSMYKEWAKLEGSAAAFKRVGESGLFSTLAPDKVPQTVEQYLALIDELEKELKADGIKGKSQRESLANELIKERFGINKDVFKEELQKALDKISKEAERQIADWNLFDKIRKATGNKDLAMSIAFGMNATAETDYPAMVKKQFDEVAKAAKSTLTFDTVTPELLKDAPDEVRKAWEDATKRLSQYAREQKDAIADILSEYQSLQNKLMKIDADRERKIKTVRKSDMSDSDKAKYIQRINVEADYQKFTQSNEYLQFFGGIYALTMQQAQQIGDLIEENLNRKLQAGAISAEEYYKEIERVRQQLDKLRNVKSNALTFMTEGFKGLNKKAQEENDSKRLETIQKIKDLEEKVAEAKAKVKGIDDTEGHGAVMQAEAQLKAAKKELEIQNAIRDKLIQNQQWMENTLGVVNVIANIAQGMSDAFNTLRDMADSFGFDTDSNAWNTASTLMDTLTTVTGGVQKTLQSLMSGDIGGVISGVFDTLLTPITIWNKLHDKKIQKDIERSQKQQAQYERMISAIERRMTNFLGNPKYSGEFANASSSSGGAYGAQRDLMQKQLAEMERQKADMEAMKKNDPEAIADLADQIDEMRVKIREFAMETAKDLYGIDLKDWASQLGDALFDAWKKGEDGAEAFRKKAGDILGDVMNNILKMKILEPMMQDLSDYLFGTDGKSGAFGSDFELTPDELDGLAKKLMDGMEGVDAYNSALDQLEKMLNEKYGLSMKGDSESKSGLSAGIQSITEDTADLLASYVNAIRADVSLSRMNWDKLLDSALPQMNVVAESQLQAQRQIAENTLRNAVAAEAIQSSAELMAKYGKSIDDRLRRAQADKSMGFYLR